tara:strand:+ start:5401 stop:6135 length:735 start_codon:yes stop_codon:yes gene_type:complete
MRYFIEFSYNGFNYHGWQMQPNAITVQEKMNSCVSTLIKKKIELIAAGRTDTGVHARQMFAHFDCEKINDLEDFIFKMNSFLPNDIFIKDVFSVNKDSHARFSAISRTYEYYISNSKQVFNPNIYTFFKKLNIDKMNEASLYLLGEKDFTSFSKLHSDSYTNICNVSEIKFEKIDENIMFSITSNRFLRNMVRSIVGTLIDVGTSKIQSDKINYILKMKNRSEAGFSVPAKGLFLTRIIYPKNI